MLTEMLEGHLVLKSIHRNPKSRIKRDFGATYANTSWFQTTYCKYNKKRVKCQE